jgi:hypothetical protein
MKQIKRFTMTLLLAIGLGTAFSQTSSSANAGLYKDQHDFDQHRLSYQLNCNSRDNEIKTNNFFESPRLTVKMNDKKMVLLKKDYFGYHDCNGKDYRFHDNQLFEIIDTVFFYLYRHTALEPNAGGKGYSTHTRYYFSKKGSNLLELLTQENLEDAFAQNDKFRYALQDYARNNKGLMDYDPYLKSYKIKYLFAASLK